MFKDNEVALFNGRMCLIIGRDGDKLKVIELDSIIDISAHSEVISLEEVIKIKEAQADTRKHINTVAHHMELVFEELRERVEYHDDSKLSSPECEIFAEYGNKLKGMTYGSDEYKECLKAMGSALDHHYKCNRHHPEHFEHGVLDMNLIDLIEMLADWKAATKRHDNGDLKKSILLNQKRFNMSDELTSLLMRTAKELDWIN